MMHRYRSGQSIEFDEVRMAFDWNRNSPRRRTSGASLTFHVQTGSSDRSAGFGSFRKD